MDDLQSIALLIDADNTQPSKIEAVIREISTHGRIVVKRAYGNWRKDSLKNWEGELKRLAIKAEQQFDYVSGKNATDMALVIDTMNLLHRGIYDAFVIVSSDSDFTPLAIHLHESGVYVMGVGEKKTPEPFRNSCDAFVFLENLDEPKKKKKKSQKKSASKAVKAAETPEAEPSEIEEPEEASDTADIDEIHNLLHLASDKYQDADGFVNISTAGNFLKRALPDFDTRTYGYVKLTKLLKAFPEKYQMRHQPNKDAVLYRCLDNDTN